MDFFDGLILGLVQGLTEFLPVSSSGHLVVFQKLLGIETHDLAFDLVVHLATVLSILVFYRRLFQDFFRGLLVSVKSRSFKSSEIRFILLIVAASVPTAIIGLGFKSDFERLFSNVRFVGVGFLVTGVLLFLTRWFQKSAQPSVQMNIDATKSGRGLSDFPVKEVQSMGFLQAIFIGIVQGTAIAPGISRSGSTLAAGIISKVPRNLAAFFSFAISIPAVLGACLLEFKDIPIESFHALPLVAGFAVAFASGYVSLSIVVRMVIGGSIQIFSYYLWVLGALVLWYY